MRIATLSALVLSLAAGAGGVFLTVRGGPAAGPQAHAVSPAPSAQGQSGGDVRALEREMDSLRREMESLRSQKAPAAAASAASAASAAAAPAAEEAEGREVSDDDRREAVKQQHDSAVHQLDKDLRASAKDAAWTSQIESEVSRAVSVGSGSAVELVDCHATLCKVSIAHQDKQALDRFRDDLSGSLVYDMDILVSPDGDAFKTQIFLARQAGGLPDFRREMEEEQAL